MNEEIKNDPNLARLKKSARRVNAPKLTEDLLYKASNNAKFGPRKLHTPRLVLNLFGGAAVLMFTFALSTANTQQLTYIMEVPSELSKIGSSMSSDALMVEGDTVLSSEDLVKDHGKTLKEFGEGVLGNYVSNHPQTFSDSAWIGQSKPMWVFVVADQVYIANKYDYDTFMPLLTTAEFDANAREENYKANAVGIKLLIQGEDQVVYPLIVTSASEPELFAKLNQLFVSTTFTVVPTNIALDSTN